MPAMMQTMRGNLAADPTFMAAREATADSPAKKAFAELQVYQNHRVQQPDGSWADSPRGPEKVSVKFFGRDAELVNASNFHQGDPVCVAGTPGEPEAFTTRDGKVQARNVIMGDTVCLDSMRVTAQALKGEAPQNQYTSTATAADTQQQAAGQGYPDQYDGYGAQSQNGFNPQQAGPQAGFAR